MLAIELGSNLGVLNLPAHPDGVANHHVEGEVVIEAHAGVGSEKGHQGDQGFGAELAVFGGLNFAEQVFHQRRKIAFPRGFFTQQWGAFEPVAFLEFVANHQAAAVMQEIPNAWVEIPRHPAEGPEPHAVLQPTATFG